ncbi:MAG: YdiU family protein [Syntrophotaleaceae bacterium]
MNSRDLKKATAPGWNFDNSYARLPECLYVRLDPTPVKAPQLALFNRPLAESLGLNADRLAGEDGAAIFSGNRLPAGAEPLAQAYAGHQFGHFTMLGDGRAHLLGEQFTPKGARFDIQFKGSGQTPFSRNGDGRAALGPMLREYLISEAMHALGIPTTRSLAVVTTGQPVYREIPLPGAILTRVAASHIRVGTFEYLAAQKNREALRTLAEYTIHRHFPEAMQTDNPFLSFLQAVLERQAALVARWLQVGFIHGVMNTDNMALSGESIDFGPCAFMDRYDPATVFSSIDHGGRYAYGRQPAVAQWNLSRFAETLVPLLDTEENKAIERANGVINSYPEVFRRFWLTGMRAKLGLLNEEEEDGALVLDLLSCMEKCGADYTNSLRELALETLPEAPLFSDPEFRQWHGRWQARLGRQKEPVEESRRLMRAHNPAVIPRNHRVEAALTAAEEGDLSVLRRLLEVLGNPYEERPEYDAYRQPAPPSACAYQTFCGT